MMAKMFYTMDETKTALEKNEEEIKQLAREGRLREFRDGPRLMFKADQVEQLKAELSGGAAGDQVDLGPSDSGAPIGLVDSQGASGTSITLSDTDAGGTAMPKEDTGLSADLGLSGSVAGRGESRSGRTHSGSVINVFGAEEEEDVDPMAQTAISASSPEQINLEGVGSGSGLLDLTRESDDTSLGAELLDEIAPGGTRAGDTGAGTGAGTMSGIEEPRGGVVRTAGTPVYVEAYDPSATAFGAAALGAALFMLLGALALMAAVVGARPQFLMDLGNQSFFVIAGIGLVVAVIFGVVGLFVGRSGAPSTR